MRWVLQYRVNNVLSISTIAVSESDNTPSRERGMSTPHSLLLGTQGHLVLLLVSQLFRPKLAP